MGFLEKKAFVTAEEVIQLRREIHRQPELSWQETATQALLLDRLSRLNCKSDLALHVHTRVTGGIIIEVLVSENYNTLLFRAEMDALPIEEKTGLSFTSQNDGVFHACGHDAHTAMLWVALEQLLTDPELELKHNLIVVFQQAEEGAVTEYGSGGKELVNTISTDPDIGTPDEVYALHLSVSGSPGTFYSYPGGVLASADLIQVTFDTAGGHTGFPHEANNALLEAARAIPLLQQFAQRFWEPTEAVVLEPTSFSSGSRVNIIPMHAAVAFVLHTFQPDCLIEKFITAMESWLRNRYSSETLVNVCRHHVLPATINRTGQYEHCQQILADHKMSLEEQQLLVSDDFAHYLEKWHGCYVSLDAWQNGTGPHHSPFFNPDEGQFQKGVLFWFLLATH